MSEKTASDLPVAGEQAILSRRYVDAFLALAEKEGVVDAVATDMQKLRQLWADCAEWRFVANDPRLGNDVIVKAVGDVIALCGLGKLSANFLSVVAQNRRLSLLPLLVEHFFAEVSARRGEIHADIRAAHSMSEDQKQKLLVALGAAVGRKVSLHVEEDVSLLGGLTVKMGSQFIDASVKTKLDLLERNLRKARAIA